MSEARDVVEEIRAFFGEVGELWKSLAANPDLLRALWASFKGIMDSGTLDRQLKLMIGYEAAKAHGCPRCAEGYRSLLYKMGLDKELVAGLEKDIASLNLPEDVKAILIFSYALATNPREMHGPQLEAFRGMGISGERLVEAAATLYMWWIIVEGTHILSH